jgi:cellulose biosynthesis protein BcsQ
VTPEDEDQKGVPAQGGLAKDVARLYSYAHVEEGNYRIFSRGPRAPRTERPLAEITEKPPVLSETAPEAAEEAAPVEAESTKAQAATAEVKPASAAPAVTAQVLPPASPRITVENRPAAIPRRPVEITAKIDPVATQKTTVVIGSFAGGTGKTTFAANIGRILSAQHERVLLVDASGSTLLPFYFGAEDMRGGMRTFLSPEQGASPLHVIGSEQPTREWLENEVKCAMQTAQRTIFDLGPASFPLFSEIFQLSGIVMVPLLTDLNSILSIPRIEAYHEMMLSRGQKTPLPVYVSNKFDSSSERERGGRELIAREVGDRLLPISIRRSTEVSEAIAQRMTVTDYAGESAIAQEFLQLALWIKEAAPVAEPAKSTRRWSEA